MAVRYDDLEFWRLPTTGKSVIWYSPEVRGVVREQSDAQYIEHNENAAEVYTQHLLLELTAFTPGQRPGQ